MDTTNIITLVILGALFLYLVSIFNQLVSLKNRFKNAFSQIDVQLKRRYDLIPNLIETAKGYMKHEKETLENVIAARNSASKGLESASSAPGDASSMNVLAQAENKLSSALGQFNLVMEDYPDLKANQNMMQLSEELSSTENRVAFARQAFNDSVMEYNTYRQSFPQNILSGFFGHTKDANLLNFDDQPEIQQAPKVSF